MLLQLFEMQDRNSAWTALCRSQQLGNDSRKLLTNLQHSNYNASSVHCSNITATTVPTRSHKHYELDSSCNDLSSLNNNYCDCIFHRSQQAICDAKIKMNQLSNTYQSELSMTLPSSSQATISESAMCSNSINHEKDVSKLPITNKISHDTKPSKLRLNLTVPNGE